MQDTILENAFRHCEQQVRRHYENFPVASWFLPKHLRRPIAVIYAFARQADDIADEGQASAEQRLQQLENYQHQLRNEKTEDPVFIALQYVIRTYSLPTELFTDLLTAFKMDTHTKRYTDFGELLNYCRYSANPIGRLLVHLNHCTANQALEYADQICTALQLINFYQDLEQDYQENGRIYLPQDEMQQYGVSERHIREKRSDKSMRDLMSFQIRRARDMLLSGKQLGTMLPGRMGFELRMVIAGGRRICEKLLNNRGNVFTRPRLNKRDWLIMFWQSLTHA